MAVDGVALSGLIIALVALLIALGQLLQQLFATTNGWHNCQAPIMGPWAKLTEWKLKRDFRVQTRFVVPYITMDECDHKKVFCITGSKQSRANTHCPEVHKGEWPELNTAGEMVSWIFFLNQLHHMARSYPEGPYRVQDVVKAPPFYGPCLKALPRTWDFMSPEIIKPLAVCTLGSIAVLARRLGMIWRQFRPGDSILRAEGNQMTITSTNVRSVGTVLAFDMSLRKSPGMALGELYIPKREADMMGFGIVPVWYSGKDNVFGNPGNPLQRPICIGTPEDCIQTLMLLCGDGEATEELQKNLERGRWTPGFSDIIPLASPMIYTKGSTLTRLPKPSDYVVGLTVFRQGHLVFRNRLKAYVDKKNITHQADNQAVRVLGWYDELASKQSEEQKEWSDERGIKPYNDQSMDFLSAVFDKGIEAEQYLKGLNDSGQLRYEDLVGCHIERAVFYKRDASQQKKPRDTYGDTAGDGAWKLEGMHRYFRYIVDPEMILKAMKGRGYKGSHELLAEAWFTMIFRAFCWHRCHYMVSGQRVPSQYWDSRLPVYIT